MAAVSVKLVQATIAELAFRLLVVTLTVVLAYLSYAIETLYSNGEYVASSVSNKATYWKCVLLSTDSVTGETSAMSVNDSPLHAESLQLLTVMFNFNMPRL